MEPLSEAVMGMLREHYAEPDARTFYLPDLGKWLADNGLERSSSDSLSEWVAKFIVPEFELVVDPQVPARRAIVPSAMKSDVLAAWARASSAGSGGSETTPKQTAHSSFLLRTPRALLIAFHLRPDDPKDRVFVRLDPPAYRVQQLPPSERGWLEVPDEFRPTECVRFQSLEQLDVPEIRGLEERVERWLASVGLTVHALVSRERKPDARSPRNALERLIFAQSERLRSSVLIPADIAELLLRLP